MTPFYGGVIISTLANFLFVLKVHTTGISESSMYWYIETAHIDEATLVWCVGNAFIFIGYEVFHTRSFPSIAVEIKSKKVVKNIFIFIVVFTLMHLFGYAISLRFLGGGVEKVLSLLGVVGIMFYARLWVVEDSKTYRTYALILCALQTVFALYSSFLRVDLLTPAVSMAAGYFIGKGSIRYLFTYRLLPIIGLMLVFSMFFQSLAGNRAHFIDSFTAPASSDPFGSSYNVVRTTDKQETGGAMERSSNITQLTNVVKLVKRNGHYDGRASAPLIAALIPRFLWPDKPIIQLGAWFALEIGAATIVEGRANNSINMTIPGQIYLDFGWIGLCVGGILFGGLLAGYWNASKFMSSPYNLTGSLWGGYLLLYALGGIGADLQIVISLTSAYIVFLVIKKITYRHETNRLGAAVEGQ
ncbi:MAG: hypothetical protein V4649_02615 [Bacteroidota bacterium]